MVPDTGDETGGAADGSVADRSFAADAVTSEVPRDSGRADLSSSQLAYLKLLSAFPEDKQGLGVEPNETVPLQTCQTYGLVLSAEAIRLRNAPSDEGGRRVRKATRWLMDNHLDKDGKPGWGWPEEYRAFDGTTLPKGMVYTIDNAIVLYGLLDALAVPGFWSAPERDAFRSLIKEVVLRWCRELWKEATWNGEHHGGFFTYDTYDTHFAVNVSAMFTGAMLRFLHEHGDAVSRDERTFVESRADGVAEAMVFTVRLRKGLPYWGYLPMPGADPVEEGGHDTLHHAYTISGIELYRDLRGAGAVTLPWTHAQAVSSLDTFWYDGHINSYSADDPKFVDQRNEPAILWCAGFMLRTYGMWGERSRAAQAFDAIVRDYGPLPYLSYYAKGLPRPHAYAYQGDNTAFFPRWAAHVLEGMAYHAFAGP